VFVVPGQYTWTFQSIYAVCSRGAGGTNTRTLTLTLTDDTHTLAQSPFLDTAPDPGLLALTWADMQLGSTALATDNVGVNPWPTMTLAAGYHLIGSIDVPQAADRWTSAVCWVDETYAG
jgi:hypothetical protein